jgi:hypothetical protein
MKTIKEKSDSLAYLRKTLQLMRRANATEGAIRYIEMRIHEMEATS